MRLTTQVLFLSVVEAGPESRASYLTPTGSSSLDPMAFARRLAPESDVLPALLAYSMESASGMTLTRYRVNDGSSLTLSVQPLGGGFVVALREAWKPGRGSSHTPIFVPSGQAAVFTARIEGRECSVVVQPLMPAGEGRSIEGGVTALSQSFTDAVERFPNRDLLGLQVDWPFREEALASSELVAMLTSRMLVADLLSTRY